MKEILQLNGIVFLTKKYEKKNNPEEVYNGATHDNYRFFDKEILQYEYF